MRFLADENIPRSLARSLAAEGHDVASVSRDAGGASDPVVLDRALREARILLTFDKDFGDLAHGASSVTGFGVILLRIPMPKIREMIPELVRIICTRPDWPDSFSVITLDRVRTKPLK